MSNHSSDRTSRLRLGEKLGYGVGDLGFNLYWTTIASFLLAFYTDVFGISAAAAATMLLVTKIIDACTDPLMGAIADRTHTRFGKFRPYLIIAGLPMAGAGVLAFSTPNLDEGGKLIYAYFTYTFMMMMYTVLSTPYSALSGVMTARSQDRTSLISIRFIFAFSCGFFVNYFTLDLVEHFGQGDDARGWQFTMILYGALAALAFLITAVSTKERISPPVAQRSNPVQDIKDLLDNRPWVILFVLAMVIMITIAMRGGSAYYYFTYFLERPDLLGAYLGVQMIFYAIGAACAPLMTRYLDKAKLVMVLMTIVGVLSIAFWFVPKPDARGVVKIDSDSIVTLRADALLGAAELGADVTYQWHKQEKAWWIFTRSVAVAGTDNETYDASGKQTLSVVATGLDEQGNILVTNSAKLPIEIIIMFILNALISLALGPKSPLTWSMYADAADYTEWQKGRRATAMTFSAATFSQKLGGAVGSATMGWVLAYFGYVANQAQSGASQGGIIFLQTAGPGVFALFAVFVTRHYDLTGARLEKIQQDLKTREESKTDAG